MLGKSLIPGIFVGDFKMSHCHKVLWKAFSMQIRFPAPREDFYFFLTSLETSFVSALLVTQQRQKATIDPWRLHRGFLDGNFSTDSSSLFWFFVFPSLRSKLKIDSQTQPKVTRTAAVLSLLFGIPHCNPGLHTPAARRPSGAQRPHCCPTVF